MDDGRPEEIGRPAADSDQSAIYNLQSAIATALAGLGATEDDRPLIEGVARAMAELGLTDEKPHS